MGSSMSLNVRAAGHDLTVYDIRRDAAAPHLAAGAKWADSPRHVAETAEVVFTSLPGPREVEAGALGNDGLLGSMRSGAVWFELTTDAPAVVRRLRGQFAARGLERLAAPVGSGPRRARQRKLALWVGGDRAVFEKYKTVLDALGDQAMYVGPIGAGLVAKLVHNCAGYAIQAALAEVFTLGVKGGVEPLALWQAVRQG